MIKEGRADNSLATAFSQSLPNSGTFTGMRFTIKEWFVKAKATISGTVWYTNNVTDDNFTYQRFAIFTLNLFKNYLREVFHQHQVALQYNQIYCHYWFLSHDAVF